MQGLWIVQVPRRPDPFLSLSQNSSAPLAEDIDPEVSTLSCPVPFPPLTCPPQLAAETSLHQARGAELSSLLPWQLARYLNRNYWEKKQEEARKSPTPSAPLSLTELSSQPGEVHTAPLSLVEVGEGPGPQQPC